jgi:bifunctional non-homologous end joining protein LigD
MRIELETASWLTLPAVRPPANAPASLAKRYPRQIMARTSKPKVTLPAGALPSPLPARLAAHLAVLGDAPLRDAGWVIEIKYDGYRMLTRVDSDVRIYTRNGHDWTTRLPQLRAQLESMGLPSAWYDGEIVACDESGRPDFERLQQIIARQDKTTPLAYYLFDLPYVLEHDLRPVPLVERRAVLQSILASCPKTCVRFSQELKGPPAQLLDAACAMQLEGLVCKRADSAYVDGRRSTAWRKLKCRQKAELVIGGYTGTRTLDKVLLGLPSEDGRLRYAGSVSTGLSETARMDLHRALNIITTDESPFTPGHSPAYGKWVKPILVAVVSFAEWTKSGKARHSALHGIKVR